jgi:hypothetical protein
MQPNDTRAGANVPVSGEAFAGDVRTAAEQQRSGARLVAGALVHEAARRARRSASSPSKPSAPPPCTLQRAER